jgi:hypothetical protein
MSTRLAPSARPSCHTREAPALTIVSRGIVRVLSNLVRHNRQHVYHRTTTIISSSSSLPHLDPIARGLRPVGGGEAHLARREFCQKRRLRVVACVAPRRKHNRRPLDHLYARDAQAARCGWNLYAFLNVSKSDGLRQRGLLSSHLLARSEPHLDHPLPFLRPFPHGYIHRPTHLLPLLLPMHPHPRHPRASLSSGAVIPQSCQLGLWSTAPGQVLSANQLVASCPPHRPKNHRKDVEPGR